MSDDTAITNKERREFLNDLDNSHRVEVTDWEAEFLESTMEQRSFSPKQRVVIDRMIDKYDRHL